MFRYYNTILFLLISLVLVPSLTISSLCAQQKYVFRQPKMGAPFTLVIYGRDSIKTSQAADDAFKKIDTLNTIFSDYLENSELNQLSRTSGRGHYVPVSDELFNLLKCAVKASRLSKGSFDITVGPVVRQWRKARKTQTFPNVGSLKKALLSVGYRYVHLDSIHHSVWLEKPNMQLDLGGIAKGYAAQAALAVVRQHGFPSVMINAGGDIALGDPPPGRDGWHIAISVPENKSDMLQKMLLLDNKAVATSGDVYRYLEWKGKRYSHIINPKTGYGVTYLRNVTVIAPNGTMADWLASACSVLPIRKALRLIKKIPETALLIAEKRGDKIIQISSDNFKKYEDQ